MLSRRLRSGCARRDGIRLVALTLASAAILGGSFGCGEAPLDEPAVTDWIPPADPALPPPEDLSLPSRFGLAQFLGAAANLGMQSGYVALFARDGRPVYAVTAGYADIERKTPMSLSTRFRMASMTKPVTATAAMLLVEEGRLSLDDPVARYVPKAADLRVARSAIANDEGRIETEPLVRPLRVRDLLEFRSGIGAKDEEDSDLGRLWASRDIYAGRGSLAERVDRILEGPLYEQPGTRWRYGWSADVLARVVEVAAGEPFGAFVRRRILEPLGMTRTGFLSEPVGRSDLATMYTKDTDGEIVRLEAAASDALDWTPGGSGLVSTAGDYMRFALMLWNHGSYDGVRILAPETVAAMTTAHVESGVLAEDGIDGLGWGLGLAVVVDSEATPTTDRDGDFWWAGYYATTFFVSPETGLVGVVLAQDQPTQARPRPYPVYVAQTFAFFGL